MTALGEFLERNLRRHRVSGEHDCACFPANWAIECGRPDPMVKWRGAYSTEAQAEDIIADAGGLVALFSEGLAGCDVVEEPQAGDIGVVELLGEQAGAIFTGKRWAFVAERGLAFASLDAACLLKVWRP